MKALMPVKAQLLDDDEAGAWFAGRVPRRILSIPFGGPIPHPRAPRGVDLDNEWFSERTDIYGAFPELRQSRERLVDWNHAAIPPSPRHGDPTRMMSGHILGKSILDPDPEADGWWSDLWLKAGEIRVKLIADLARKGAQLFGSSQPAGPAKRNPETGEILEWPHLLQTLSTSPQNTYSILRPAKAMLAEADFAGIAVEPALRDLFDSLQTFEADLRQTSFEGDGAAKAGRELSNANDQEIEAALAELEGGYRRLRALIDRTRAKYEKEADDGT